MIDQKYFWMTRNSFINFSNRVIKYLLTSHSHMACVWRLLNRNLIEIDIRRAWRRSPHTLPFTTSHPNCEGLNPTSLACSCFSLDLSRKEDLLSQQPLNHGKAVTTEPVEVSALWTPGFLQWTLCLQLPLRSPPFLCKRTLPSSVLRTWAWFTIKPHVPSSSSLLFSNKPILLEKYLSICVRSTCFIICWFGSRI